MQNISFKLSMLLMACAIPALATGCGPSGPKSEAQLYPRVESKAIPGPDGQGNIIPDFSRVGYMWGDVELPDVKTVITLEAPTDGSDAAPMIQRAVEELSGKPLVNGTRGAILLKKGTYNLSQPLKVQQSGIVLRGEGNGPDGTVLVATAPRKHNLLTFIGSGNMKPADPAQGRMNIKDDYVPVGRFWVRVENPEDFSPGDDVILYRAPSQEWISDLRMDRIVEREGTRQWTAEDYIVRMERVVTMISGDTLHFDNPCVMAIDSKYGGGAVFQYKYTKRLSGCGVENILFRSAYAHDEDEDHGWSAIEMRTVEHSWIRDVHSEYFGYGLVTISRSSKNITVTDCECREAKSLVTGGRRYSFDVNGSLNLVKDCAAYDGRHDYVTGAQQAGPNAFVNCVSYRANSDSGPHHRWNMGTLYDNIVTDFTLNIQDRQSYGTGHGWAGANQVLWNCEAKTAIVQNPWTSAVNYSIGTIAEKLPGPFAPRPDGIWISHGEHVEPASLYEAQLRLRHEAWPDGVFSIGGK